MARHKVLSTKKLDPLLVEQAKANGIDIIEQEFISIKPVWNKETYDRIIQLAENGKLDIVFTSANAVEILDQYLVAEDTYYVIDYRLFSLSGKTKQAIEQARLLKGTILGEAPTAGLLARKIIEQGIKEVVFFCGNKRRDELPALLKEAGVTVHEVTVYETIETPVAATENMKAILFFSPSAVQSFFSVNQLKKDTVCFAIGETTAASLADFTDNRIIISEFPSQEMMMASVNFYFQNYNCYE